MAKQIPKPAISAIQSDEQAGLEAQEYLSAVSAIDQIDAAEKAAIAALKQQFTILREPHEQVRDERFARVRAWAESTRGERKTIKFPNGRVFRWRNASRPKLNVFGTLESIVQSLMARPDWEKFLKVELKKANLSANPEVVEETEGLSLDQGEYVSIG